MTALDLRRVVLLAMVLAAGRGGVSPAADGADKADFYVATDGSDQWSGRLTAPNADKTDGPFATLTAARNALRKVGKDKPRTVLIRGGTYRLTETFVLKPVDGSERRIEGTNQPATVTYAAYPGETPVISGGRVISERFSSKPGSEVWSVHLPKGVSVADLYVAGKRMTRARMPNEGFWSAERTDATKTSFRYREGLFGAAPDAASGFAVVRPYQWCEFHLPIKSIDAATRTVTLARPCGYVVSPGGYGAPGHFRIENVAAAMDRPGEWVFNPDSGVLHLIPPTGVEDPNRVEVVAAGLPILVSLEGPSKNGTPVQYVNFVGLTFTHTGRNPKPEWGAYAGCAVRMAGAVRSCRIDRCRFVDLGAVGVTMWKGSECNGALGCEFVGTGETAVVISDHLDQPRPRTAFNVISDCEIHHCGVVNAGAKAIDIHMAEDNTVVQNHIHDVPYSGVTLSGTRPEYWSAKAWPKIEKPYTAEKIARYIPMKHNTIRDNHIHDVMQELGDGGAIYLWGLSGGRNYVEGNLIHDVGRGDELAVGLYVDDQMDKAVLRDNIVVRANWGIHLHGCTRSVVENNVIAFSRKVDLSIQPEKYNTEPMLNVIRQSVFYMGAGDLYRSYNYKVGNRPVEEMDRNLYWRGADAKLKIGIADSLDASSLVADPLFVAPEKGDFSLKYGSPAEKLDINPPDAEKVRRAAGPPYVSPGVPATRPSQ